jgi:hypothetical protein
LEDYVEASRRFGPRAPVTIEPTLRPGELLDGGCEDRRFREA